MNVKGNWKTQISKKWNRDLEQRRSRPLPQRIERPEVDLVTEIDRAMNALDESAEDFENSYGKPNQALIDSKIEAERLCRQLVEVEARLISS